MKKTKGIYGNVRLPVAGKYVYPLSRNRTLVAAAAVGAAVIAILAVGFVLRGDKVLSTGPLSSSHATFENDCSACHSSVAPISSSSVVDAKCRACHEKHGDELGVYTFDTHYIYHSANFSRAGTRDGELACHSCHAEHEGRERRLVSAADRQCGPCHFESFGDGHPEFDFAALSLPDASNLRFAHINHVRRLIKRLSLTDIEQACLYCHVAGEDGAGFRPIDFDDHCATCHLNGGTSTEDLRVVSSARASKTPGVRLLEDFRSDRSPGSLWAALSDPGEFRARQGQVRKINVRHRDPWIMANLRELRRVQYPDAELVDLLPASSRVDPGETRVLFEEAVATLRSQALELRLQPQREVQRDLNEIDRQLAALERRLRQPYTVLDDSRFAIGPQVANPELDATDMERFEGFVDTLTASCQQCHLVASSTIVRVQKDQRSLRRAHFNHRAHILQLRCLDCHVEIPIGELAGLDTEVDLTRDNAAILNLPRIGMCQSCHAEGKAASSCATCHDFHPNKTQRSNLLLSLD